MNKNSRIAFCFLTYDKIIRYDIWNTFFENIDTNKYIVMIHPKKNEKFNMYSFPHFIIKNKIITTSKDNINIVRATLQLLKETHEIGNISHYIFLSQSCIPLYSFDTLYNIIIRLNKSLISCIQYNRKERYLQLSNFMKNSFSFHSFIKQQPNMILINNDVKFLINYDYTNHFSKMTCPDEHYFVNILLHIFKKNIIKQQTHFCNYNLDHTQALEFYNIDQKFILSLRKLGFLFIRKVKDESFIDKNFLFCNTNIL